MKEKHLFILCIQETKLLVFYDSVCKSLWGDANVAYSYQPLVGYAGDLVTLCDCTEFDIWSSISFEHVLAIIG